MVLFAYYTGCLQDSLKEPQFLYIAQRLHFPVGSAEYDKTKTSLAASQLKLLAWEILLSLDLLVSESVQSSFRVKTFTPLKANTLDVVTLYKGDNINC